MKKNWSVKMLTEAGIMIALSFILGRIKLFSMPQGGSVTAGQMIPLIIFAIRYGAVSYTHLTLPTIHVECRSRWSPYH